MDKINEYQLFRLCSANYLHLSATGFAEPSDAIKKINGLRDIISLTAILQTILIGTNIYFKLSSLPVQRYSYGTEDMMAIW
jgi:hypothetical protein